MKFARSNARPCQRAAVRRSDNGRFASSVPLAVLPWGPTHTPMYVRDDRLTDHCAGRLSVARRLSQIISEPEIASS